MTVEVPSASKLKKGKTTADESEGEGDEEFTTVGKGGKSMQFSPETILKNLQVVQEARGKKVIRNSSCRSCDITDRETEH